MTSSEVHAILSSKGRCTAGYSPGIENWFFAAENIGQDRVEMTVEYEDGRVMHVDRRMEHGIRVAVPVYLGK